LSPETVARYKAQYSGVFHDRYILGKWTLAEGLVYPNYEDCLEPPRDIEARHECLSVDYGTQNATAALRWSKDAANDWHAVAEYYYSGRETQRQKTDAEYVADMVAFSEGMREPVEVIVDPSAASFIAALKRCPDRKFKVLKARNDVLDGIRETASCMGSGRVKVSTACKNLIAEFQAYVWDDKAGEDRPVKDHDHACDALRYMVATKKLAKPESEYHSVFGG
jgi:PBSX family phage terminase large subunit